MIGISTITSQEATTMDGGETLEGESRLKSRLTLQQDSLMLKRASLSIVMNIESLLALLSNVHEF